MNKYTVVKTDVKTAFRASVLDIAGVRVEGPFPVLTSRDVKAVDRCAEHIDGIPTFEGHPVYQYVQTIGELTATRRYVVPYAALDDRAGFSTVASRVEAELKGVRSLLKSWHPQLGFDELTVARRKGIVEISMEAGAQLIEARRLNGESQKAYSTWLDAIGPSLSTNQCLVPTVDASLSSTVFAEHADWQIANRTLYPMLNVVGYRTSNADAAQNLSYLKSTVTQRLSVVVSEVMNSNARRKGVAKKPTPMRGMELIRDYGVAGFSERINPPPKTEYTLDTAKRLDNIGGGYEKLNKAEYLAKYGGSLELGCECAVCTGKDADSFYGMRSHKETFSGFAALHTALSLPPLVSALRVELVSV